MTMMLSKLYAALKAAGTPDSDAQAAAEEAGDMHEQFGGLQTAMQQLHVDVTSELSGMRAEFNQGLAKVSGGLASLGGEVTKIAGELVDLRGEVTKATAGLADLRGEFASLRGEFAYLRGRFDVLLWAVGINAAATIAILGVLLRR